MKRANVEFSVVAWDETPYFEGADGAKTTRASIKYKYEGDMVGEAELEYLMHYTTAGTATFVGLERFSGTLNGRNGSFVFTNTGVYNDTGTHINLEIATGSGTGELTSIHGSTSFVLASEAEKYEYVLEYSL